jgi:hypothetical protein
MPFASLMALTEASRYIGARQKEKRKALVVRTNPELRPFIRPKQALSTQPVNSSDETAQPLNYHQSHEAYQHQAYQPDIHQSFEVVHRVTVPDPFPTTTATTSSSSSSSPHPVLSPIHPSANLLPDPLLNAKRLLPTRIFSAILHNARLVRIPASDIRGGCSVSNLSPFFRPSSPSSTPSALLSSVHATLPPDTPATLLPTLTQVLVPHHVSFDLIPLPRFRDQAIMLSMAMPSVYSAWELKVDIYERGGMTCFEVGVPWERGSWVAEPWFLRKWSIMVEDEKDSLGKSAAVVEALARVLNSEGQEYRF